MGINFVISGEAGQGIETASEIASKLLHAAGFSAFTYNEYMSRIRGGCNSVLIKVGGAPCFSERIDVLFVLDEKVFERLKNRISDKTIVVDAQKNNIFAIGYIAAFFGLDNVLESLKSDFPKIFGDE
jgi:2-oxoglutarate ferredoxin oxidoreductase subunit alpha